MLFRILPLRMFIVHSGIEKEVALSPTVVLERKPGLY